MSNTFLLIIIIISVLVGYIGGFIQGVIFANNTIKKIDERIKRSIKDK